MMRSHGIMRRGWLAIAILFLAIWPTVASAEDVAPTSRVTRSVVVRASPTTASDSVGRLLPGQRATLIKDQPGWYQVRLADGTSGWVSKVWTDLVAETAVPVVATSGAEYRVHIIDVGTGLSVFVEGADFTLLYDGGSQDDLADGPDNRIVAYIRAVRPDLRRIDYLILSHPHKDHLELLPDVFAAYEISDVWDSGALNRTLGYCRFLRAVAAEPGVRYHDAIATGGSREVTFANASCAAPVRITQSSMMTAEPVRLGAGAAMSMLYRDASPHSDPNENTVVVRLDLGAKRVLLGGDAEAGGRELPSVAPSAGSIEATLLACCRAALKADALVVGHHGSLTSSRRAFLDAVGATVFAVSSGPHPYSRVTLPDAAVIAELTSRGQVFRTDDHDDECALSTAKIGPDADESPGGCSNILMTISGSQLSAGPGRGSD